MSLDYQKIYDYVTQKDYIYLLVFSLAPHPPKENN